MYFRSTINAYSSLLHEKYVSLIKFMVKPTIYVRGEVCIYGTSGIPNNFPQKSCSDSYFPKLAT